jgi:hypothetical protein
MLFWILEVVMMVLVLVWLVLVLVLLPWRRTTVPPMTTGTVVKFEMFGTHAIGGDSLVWSGAFSSRG